VAANCCEIEDADRVGGHGGEMRNVSANMTACR
jgi:hypothetical protein